MARRLKLASIIKKTRNTKKSPKNRAKYLMYCTSKYCTNRFTWSNRGNKWYGMVLMYGTNERSEIMDICDKCKTPFFHRTNVSINRFEGIFYQEGDYIYVNP